MMHIALTIDSKFVRYCAVTIVSILENNDPKDIMLHIVSGHLPKEDILIALLLYKAYYIDHNMELISVKKFVALIRMDMPDLKSMCNIC